MEFFRELRLNIHLNWSIVERSKRMFEPLIGIQGDKMKFSEELYESFEAEGDTLTPEIISNIMSYDGLNIEKIHQILVGNRCPFKRSVHVCVKNNFDEILHIGLQPSKINYDILQEWVDTYYSYKFKSPIEKSFCGFILYLIYVRIHPHQDGNGRTARYLFLENKLLILK